MKLDLNLYKRLLSVNHPSKSEYPMMSLVINECYKIGNLEFEIDNYCNIFIKKNTTNPEYYPCVVAHMDCVLDRPNRIVKIKKDKIYGINPTTNKQIGLGMDDANGVCCALQLLKAVPDLKVCFTTEEEIGYNGAEIAAENIDFFNDVSYMIQADRRGKSDLITHTNGIDSASEDWLQDITPLMAQYGYVEEWGTGTDIGELAEKLQLSGVNISCGYDNEHSDSEHTILPHLQNCLNFMEAILKTIPLVKQYEIHPVIPYWHRYNDYGKGYNFTWDQEWDYDSKSKAKTVTSEYPKEWDDDLPCYHCKDYDCMHCPYDSYLNDSKR